MTWSYPYTTCTHKHTHAHALYYLKFIFFSILRLYSLRVVIVHGPFAWNRLDHLPKPGDEYLLRISETPGVDVCRFFSTLFPLTRSLANTRSWPVSPVSHAISAASSATYCSYMHCVTHTMLCLQQPPLPPRTL